MASKRSRSATTVGMAPRDRCQAANFASSSRDDRLGLLDFRRAPREVLLDDRLQVVDVVEEHLLDVADAGFDVARHRDVDDEERVAAVPARRRFDLRARDDRPLRSGRGDDDVGVAERLRQLFPGNRATADCRGQRLGVGRGAARDRDLADALRAQVLRRQRADLAGADDQDAPALEPAEDLSRQLHRREADRHRALAERRLAADALADVERPVKQLAQHRAGAAPFRRGLERVLDLPEDLRLADDQRVEAGGDAEQMLRRVGVGEREQMRREASRRAARDTR